MRELIALIFGFFQQSLSQTGHRVLAISQGNVSPWIHFPEMRADTDLSDLQNDKAGSSLFSTRKQFF
jgi:hypothetical protein